MTAGSSGRKNVLSQMFTRSAKRLINCGYCPARIFYNGSCSMQLLKREFKAPKRESSL